MTRKKISRVLGRLALGLAFAVVSALPSHAIEINLVARQFTMTMPDGAGVAMWGFASDADGDLNTVGAEAPSVPGPMITIPAADGTLTINLRNELGVPVSVVIPALATSLSPVKFTDAAGRQRTQSFTDETPPGAIGTYSWSGVAPGAYMYHSGTHPAVQVQMGLYGGVRKSASAASAYPPNPAVDSSFDTEVALFYGEIDPALHDAVAGGEYGTASYPSAIDFRPRYFLVNGSPWRQGRPPIAAGEVNGRILIRFYNAGMDSRAPVIQGAHLDIIAEDGKVYPHAKKQYSVLLAAGKTIDAIMTASAPGRYPVYDRRLFLLGADASAGGMLEFLDILSAPSAPVATNDSYAVNEDGSLAIGAPGVLANDTGTSLSAVLASGAGSGALTLNADGSFSYAPSPNFSGTDVFRYTARSGSLDGNTATVSIAVNPVNDPPVAVNDTASTMAGADIDIPVLANDTDADFDSLTVAALTNGFNGTTMLNPDDTVMYMPNIGFSGTDSFTYRANDGAADSAAATVTVTVNPRVNAAPVAVDDYTTTRANTAVTINVLANDYDPDGTLAPSTVAIAARPARRGIATVNANGTISYTPRRNFRGTDVFTYTVRDNEGALSNQATVRVNVVR